MKLVSQYYMELKKCQDINLTDKMRQKGKKRKKKNLGKIIKSIPNTLIEFDSMCGNKCLSVIYFLVATPFVYSCLYTLIFL